jgi:hypothetical protein
MIDCDALRSQPRWWQNWKRSERTQKIQRVPQPCCLKKRARAFIVIRPPALLLMRRAVLPQGRQPYSLIATQAINSRTEKFIRFLGSVSAIDSCGRTIWIADAHHGDGKSLVVRADEKLTAFVELDFADCVPGLRLLNALYQGVIYGCRECC